MAPTKDKKTTKVELTEDQKAREVVKEKIKNNSKDKKITGMNYANSQGLNKNTHWYIKKCYPKDDKRTVKEWTAEFERIKLI